jgi:glycosyltransferase involved in cell wall biosynthesis
VWIGRIDPGKCPSNAIEVAKRVGKRIVLMGPSYNYPYFVDKIWPHIDNENVVWLRAVDDKTKRRVFKKALAFINTIWDNYHEMFGITNIESLAMGVPVIGWNNSDVQSAIGFQGGEIIEHGKQGFIINHSGYSDEAREQAIQSSVESLKNIKNIDRNDCRKLFLEKFTSKIMADKTLKYYSLIKQRGKVLNVSNEL